MPMISGTHFCSECRLEMYWEHHLPELFPNCTVFKYTPGSHRVKLVNSFKSKQLEFQIECTNCNYVDYFYFDNSNYYNELKLHQKHF